MRWIVAGDWRDKRIAELESRLRERDAQVAERDAQIGELRQQVAALLARVAELEERLRKSSGNCSKPPSADSPKHAAERKKQRAKASGGRRPGGQPGRVRCVRALAPAEQVRESHVVKPSCCERCHRKLHGEDPHPTVHQVWHLPKFKPWVE